MRGRDEWEPAHEEPCKSCKESEKDSLKKKKKDQVALVTEGPAKAADYALQRK